MKKLKTINGNTGIDIVISIGIIAITLTVMVSLYFGLYVSNIEIERRSKAVGYATQILEKVSEYYYSDITEENFTPTLLPNGNKQIAGVEINKGYDVSVNITQIDGNDLTEVLKKVEVNVKYTIVKKETNITLSTRKVKEKIVLPNSPEVTEDLIPIKVIKTENASSYKTINSTNEFWYNYNSKLWALAIEKETDNTAISTEDLYVWIPRYAYSSTTGEIKFLYSNKNQTLDSSGNLQYISGDYVVDDAFKNENERGYWIEVSEVVNDANASRLNNSKYGKFIY